MSAFSLESLLLIGGNLVAVEVKSHASWQRQ